MRSQRIVSPSRARQPRPGTRRITSDAKFEMATYRTSAPRASPAFVVEIFSQRALALLLRQFGQRIMFLPISGLSESGEERRPNDFSSIAPRLAAHRERYMDALARRAERLSRPAFLKNRDTGGMIYREVQIPGGGKSRRSLGTHDRARAEELGRELLAGLMSGSEPRVHTGPVKLGELFDRFVAECPMFLDNTEGNRKDTRTRLKILRKRSTWRRRVMLGRSVKTMCDSMRHGVVPAAFGTMKSPSRARCDNARSKRDIKLLKAGALLGVLEVVQGDGSRLLERNPLEYVRVKGEHDVVRPIASLERFELATRRAMQDFQQHYAEEARVLPTERDRARAKRRGNDLDPRGARSGPPRSDGEAAQFDHGSALVGHRRCGRSDHVAT